MATASAADTRRALRELAAERKGSGKGGWVFWILLLLLLIGSVVGIAGFFLGWFTTPQNVAEFKSLVDQQVADLDKMARNEKPYTESFDGMRGMFEKMRDVPREVRDEQMMRLFEARERAAANSFFALPPQQRQAELDRRLKSEEDRRKEWMARRQQDGNQQRGTRPDGQQNAGRGGPPGGGSRGGPPGGGGGGPPGGGRRGGGEDASNARSLGRINRTSPDDRARRTEYRRMMDEARAKRSGGGGGR